MSALVLDASVAIAWYLPETFQQAARQWQDRLLASRVVLVVPSLHYWEVANVLRTYVHRGELGASLALEIFAVHLEAPLEIADPSREELLSTALEYGSTAYDAVYISLAIERDLPLLTAERATTPWVRRLGDRAVSIR